MGMIESEGYLALDDDYRADDAIHKINSSGIKEVVLFNPPELSSNIDFLACCPNIKSIKIAFQLDDVNVSSLYKMNNLEKLYLEEKSKVKIDFTKLEKLIKVDIFWSKEVDSVFQASNIRSLSIGLLNTTKYLDFTFLSELKKLEELELNKAKIKSLDGIENLRELKKLRLISLPDLSNIEKLVKKIKVRELLFHNCNKIQGLESVIGGLTELNELGLVEQKKINDINFINNLKSLKVFHFAYSNVIDGNLNPLLNKQLKLERIIFSDRDHYSHSFDEINAFMLS